jgi:putative Mg2+ transporter-C (MgtC) family protein
MDEAFQNITIHLLCATAAGGIIGLERSYHARPAGFRTHTLVCLASSLLMLITLYQSVWLPGAETESFRADPTRMSQGIMTGIGFLGAGVIFKEGLSVRGLTTAASIWMTAAIGILFGIGFYYPAVLATVLTLGVLSVFRWVEAKIPAHTYAHHHLSFDRDNVMNESQVLALMDEYKFNVANLSYRTSDDGKQFEYRMVMRTSDLKNISRLSDHLRSLPQVRAFRLSPTGD